MKPAAKHIDPVLGIDIHLHIVPPGIPVPLPNPFIGVVLDLMDYLPVGVPIIGGASVKVNGMCRAQAGTEAKNIPHIPYLPLVPWPANEGEMFMGSATVNVDGEPFTFMACPVLSCQIVGLISPFRKKKPRKTYSFQLPLSLVLPIPLGPPVMIGGPPTISLSVLLMKGVFKGLGKAFKKLRKLQIGDGKFGKFFKELSEKLHKKADNAMDSLKIKSQKVRNKVHRSICNVTGHPVDIATGKVFTEDFDFIGYGPMPFIFERVWFSTSDYEGPLGHGWHHNYDLALVVDEEEELVVIRLADGRAAVFDLPAEGEELFNRLEKAFLKRKNGVYTMRQEGLNYRFTKDPAREDTHLLEQVEEASGLTIDLDYDESGCLTQVTDGGGRTYIVESDDKLRIRRILAPHPELPGQRFAIAEYSYSEAGDLIRAEDAHQEPLEYQYKGHLLVRERRRSGLNFYFEYEGEGTEAWCVKTWGDNDLYARELQYENEHHLTLVTNSLGYTTTHHWNELGETLN